MKITVVILLAACLNASATGYSQEVSLSGKDLSLEKVFKEIKKQTGYTFVYTVALLKKTKNITISIDKTPLDQALNICLRDQPVTYAILNKIIVIREKEPVPTQNQLNILPPEVEIKGKITNNKGEPLAGATIAEKGTGNIVISKEDGSFTINVAGAKSILQVSYVGYDTKEMTVGSQAYIQMTLQASGEKIQEVVVTALGFETKKDKLGYASSKVKGEQVANSGEVGLIDALGGKASGVRVSRSSGSDPGSSSQILIRGQSTITRSTDPLIVLDGVPINGSSRNESSGNTTQQSRLNDINPDDIASIQVLKGASAAALWGTRAANGVLVITTKQGSGNKTNISFKTTYSLDEVSAFPALQSAYGQGSGGIYSPTNTRSWGDKIANRAGGADAVNTAGASFAANNGQIYYPITTKNSKDTYLKSNYDAVIGKGHYIDNSLTLSSGDSKANYFFSLSDLNQQGVIRNNSDYRRTSVRLNATKQLKKWLTVSNKTTYSLVNSDRIQRGINNAGLMIALLRSPSDFDASAYIGKYYAAPGGAYIDNRQRSYRDYLGASANPGFNNPLWVTNQLKNTSKVNRFINSAEMNITPVDWFTVTVRGGLDYFTDRQLGYAPYFSTDANTGSYSRQEYSETQFNLDVFGRAEKKIGKNVSASFLVGYNFNSLNTASMGGSTISFTIPNGPLDLNNATPANLTISDAFLRSRTNAGYFSAGLGLYDQLFLNATGRTEAASTFGSSINTFFYPSADIAWQFSRLPVFDDSRIFSFGKLRSSYGIVGIQPQAYQTSTNFISSAVTESFWNPYLDPSLYGTGSYMQSGNKGNALLKPERKEEIEIGTDLRFFDNRIQTSITWYRNKTIDALINIPQASSTGFNFLYANAGVIQNKGIELDLSYNILRKKDFSIDIDANWSKNKNKVLDLNGAGSIVLGGSSGVSSRAVEGYALGVLYSIPWLRDAKGNYQLDANGFPKPDVVSAVIGDPNPDWRGGIGFTVKYKQFSFNTLVERSQGGKVIDGTEAVLLDYGVSAATAVESTAPTALKRYDGTTIAAGTTFRGSIKDFGNGNVALEQSWYTGPGGWFGNVGEQFLKDATWTRLREVTLAWTLNAKKLQKLAGINSIVLEVSGRNLVLISDVKGFDPDTNVSGSISGRGVVYFDNPPTRSYLFTAKFNF